MPRRSRALIATAADGERRVMGYLRRTSTTFRQLCACGGAERLVEAPGRGGAQARRHGLGLRQAKDVDLWMDYGISGNAPLTRPASGQGGEGGGAARPDVGVVPRVQLVSRRARVVLRRRRGRSRPTDRFVVRMARPTIAVAGRVQGRARPSLDRLRLRARRRRQRPRAAGYPSPENAPDSRDFYMAVGSWRATGRPDEDAGLPGGMRRPAHPSVPRTSRRSGSASSLRPLPRKMSTICAMSLPGCCARRAAS